MMNRPGRLVCALLIAGLVASGRAGAQDDPYSTLEFFRTLPPEEMLYSYDFYKNQYDRYIKAGPSMYGPGWEKYWHALIADCERILLNIRAALGEKGTRPPGEFVPTTPGMGDGGGSTARDGARSTGPTQRPVGGGDTRQLKPPSGGGGDTQRITKPESKGPSYAAPLAVFMTAGHLAECATEGKSPAQCAQDFALKTAIGLPVGVAITVLSPVGAVAAAGIAVLSSAGSIFIALEQAGANYDRASAQRANAERVDAAQMEALASSLIARIQQTAIDPSVESELDQAGQELARMVGEARTLSQEFGGFNEESQTASAMCSDPQRQPLAAAARADQRLAGMEQRSTAIGERVAEAAALAAACATVDDARRAKQLYAAAQKDLRDLEQAGDDTRADVKNALAFFTTVKAARTAMQNAARRIASLESKLDEVRSARSRIADAADAYAAEADAHARAMAGVAMSIRNLRGAFPDTLPPHLAPGFARTDSALTEAVGSVLTDERLTAIETAAGDDVSRVEGLIREARERFDDLRTCGQITGDIPEPLQKDLTRIGNGAAAAYAAAERAVAGGADVAARADACIQRLTGGPGGEGRLAGQCTGTIGVTPLQGPPGSPLRVTVTIDPPGDRAVTRVVAENPGCATAACREMLMVRPGQYALSLTLQAPGTPGSAGGILGTFRVKVSALGGDRPLCGGESALVTVRMR
jgi:hypothetical protein